MAQIPPNSLRRLVEVFQSLNRLDFSVDLLVARHAPTQESEQGVVQGRRTESDIIPDQAAVYVRSLQEEVTKKSQNADNPLLLLQSPVSRCRQTADLFNADATQRVIRMDIEAARDIDIPNLAGRLRDDPEISRLFATFASNPFGFEHDGESGAFMAYCILLSFHNMASNSIMRDLVHFTTPINLVAAIITHQVPMRALLDASNKGIFNGLQTAEVLSNGNFWLRIDARNLRTSLKLFELAITTSIPSLGDV